MIMFRCPKCRYHQTVKRHATGGDMPMWPSVGAGSTWTLSKCYGCNALFASANGTDGFVPDEVKKDPEVTICTFEDLVLPKWIALVYGHYGADVGYVGWGSAKPSVRELRADTAEECWELLRAAELTDGDKMDDIDINYFSAGRVKVRLFWVEEVSFPWFDAYVAERTKRETEAAKRSADELEEKALLELAAKRGYSLTKTT